jgi:hypothetical protein
MPRISLFLISFIVCTLLLVGFGVAVRAPATPPEVVKIIRVDLCQRPEYVLFVNADGTYQTVMTKGAEVFAREGVETLVIETQTPRQCAQVNL